GRSPLAAALLGSREMAMPVVAMSLTRAAGYAPIGFLEGITGALFKEFVFALADSVFISGVVARTRDQMMSSRLWRPDDTTRGLAARLDRLFHGMQVRYQRLLHSSMETRGVTLTFGVLVLLLIPALLMFTRSELAPSEDQSFVFMLTNAPQTA